MKKLLPTALCVLMLTSCARYAQVYYAVSRDGSTTLNKNFHVFENDTIRVAYNFWDLKGTMSFLIENKLNVPIYIDWKKSSFVSKGEKKNYYDDVKTSKYVTVGATASTQVSLAAIFRPLYSTWYVPGTVGGRLSNSVSVTDGVELKQERVSFIPPHSYVLKSTGFKLIPGPIKTYKDSTRDAVVEEIQCKERVIAPQVAINVFRNFFTYSTTESFVSEHYLDNTFYVGRILSMNVKKFVGKIVHDEKGNPVIRYPFLGGDRFYITNLYRQDVF